jgi:hypothetical protein
MDGESELLCVDAKTGEVIWGEKEWVTQIWENEMGEGAGVA